MGYSPTVTNGSKRSAERPAAPGNHGDLLMQARISVGRLWTAFLLCLIAMPRIAVGSAHTPSLRDMKDTEWTSFGPGPAITAT